MDIQTRNQVMGDGWRSGASRPAGLYGELPPLPLHPPARTALAPRPVRKNAPAD